MSTPRIRILLIEDNPADARLLKEVLAEARGPFQHELVTVNNLTAGLEQLLAAKPGQPGAVDIVLCDLSLPDAMGTEAVRQVCLARQDIPLVVLTGLDDDETALRAMKSGAQDYLVKGQFDAQLLSRAIRYAIERKRAEEDGRRLMREHAARLEAEAAAARARFLAEAGKLLASSLELEPTLYAVAELGVPFLGELCVIDVVEGGSLRRMACVSNVPELRAEVDALRNAFPRDAARSLSRLGGRGTQLFTPERLPELGTEAAEVEAWRALGPQALLRLPLWANGAAVGQMTFAALRRGPYSAEEMTLAEALADRVSLTVINARLYRAREDVIGIVSHDLRNPLNVIAFAAGALRRGGTPEQQSRQLERIERTVARMDRLIQDLLDVNRIEAGGLAVTCKPTQIRGLVEEAVEGVRAVAEERSIHLRVSLEPELPLVNVDSERMLQVFSNLLGNALKFTPEGGKVTVGAKRHSDGHVRFEVQDSGPGISEGDRENVFERFWQGGRATRHGAGLGLAIARGIVEAHGGRIWVDSPPACGACFFFTLPPAPAQVTAIGSSRGSAA